MSTQAASPDNNTPPLECVGSPAMAQRTPVLSRPQPPRGDVFTPLGMPDATHSWWQESVQRQLGHAQTSITLDSYSHPFPTDLGEISTKMTQVLAPRLNSGSTSEEGEK